LGFLYKKEGKDYTHPAAIIVLSPEGKITRYLHGTYFLPFDLKMAITEASQGKATPTINKMLKFCFSYDPAGRRYVFNITKITGAIVLLCALGLFFFLFFKKKPEEVKPTEKIS
jgi:protein SCO1